MKLWIAIILMLSVLFITNWFLYTQPLVIRTAKGISQMRLCLQAAKEAI
jgi:hypothetical protein